MLFPIFQNYKTKQKICSIKGFTSLTANQIVNNIPEFLSFIKEINYKINLSYQNIKSKYTYVLCFEIKIEKINENGNDIAQTISKMLIY